MGFFDALKDKLDSINSAIISDTDPVSASDETTFPNSPRNAVVSALGMPQSWQNSRADEKRYYQNLPEQMGTAAAGTVKDLGAKETAAALLAKARNSGFGKTVAINTEPAIGKVIIPQPGEKMAITIARRAAAK